VASRDVRSRGQAGEEEFITEFLIRFWAAGGGSKGPLRSAAGQARSVSFVQAQGVLPVQPVAGRRACSDRFHPSSVPKFVPNTATLQTGGRRQSICADEFEALAGSPGIPFRTDNNALTVQR
jgi:hypothetical protein